MNKKFDRNRYACMECRAFYKCEKNNINSTAGGREKVHIEGKELICCIPGEDSGAFKAMKQYAYYCLATPKAKMIAGMADYTGKVPLWCPRLEAKEESK